MKTKSLFMNIKFYLILPFFCFSLGLLQAQNGQFIGSWTLDEIVLEDFIDDDHVFPQEESFFGHYLNPNESLRITDTYMPVIIGDEQQNFTYELNGSKLILTQSNNVMVQKEGKIEHLTTQGNTEFKVKLTKNKLVISRRNETFFESYTFHKNN